MKRFTLGVLMCLVFAVAGSAWAGHSWEYMDGKKADFGFDLRLRYEHWDRDVVTPNWSIAGMEMGPAVEYLRIRERVWGNFELTDGAKFYIRLANRWHETNSHWLDPNDQFRRFPANAQSGNTWGAPDEVYIDNLYLDFTRIADSNWSLRLGRQDLVLGNGMVFLEGTPFDQGRSIYVDGAVAKYETECDTLKVFGLYDEYRDEWGAIANDQKRQLRFGDTGVLGAYWTHHMQKSFNTDLYFIYANINDVDSAVAERAWSADMNADLNIAGARAFGALSGQVDYSVEYAQQFGNFGGIANAAGREQEMTGYMWDGRLNFKAAEGTSWSPVLGLEYTRFSGDDPSSTEEFEGWQSVFAAYPIWREELLPIMLNGNWSNLDQYRSSLTLNLRDNPEPTMCSPAVKLTGSWAYLTADHGETGTGQGSQIGHLFSGFLDFTMSKNWDFCLEAVQFYPGDYWQDGHSSEWLRFQTVYKF